MRYLILCGMLVLSTVFTTQSATSGANSDIRYVRPVTHHLQQNTAEERERVRERVWEWERERERVWEREREQVRRQQLFIERHTRLDCPEENLCPFNRLRMRVVRLALSTSGVLVTYLFLPLEALFPTGILLYYALSFIPPHILLRNSHSNSDILHNPSHILTCRREYAEICNMLRQYVPW